MKRLVVLSLLVCALNSTLAFAERWVPIQIGGMTTYVNTVLTIVLLSNIPIGKFQPLKE